MSKKKDEKQDELDTETTFADMNVDGFKWYDPAKKTGRTMNGVKLTRREKWAIFKAAVSTLWPLFLFALVLFGVLYLACYLWLGI